MNWIGNSGQANAAAYAISMAVVVFTVPGVYGDVSLPAASTWFSPNAALLLVAGGTLAMYAEFLRPGMLLPGAGGATAILLGLLSFAAYPVRSWSALLVGLSMASVVWAGWRLSRGESKLDIATVALAISAITGMAVGSATLIDTERMHASFPSVSQVDSIETGTGVSLWLAVTAALTLGLSTLWLLSMVLRSFRLKQKTYVRTMPGSIAIALDELHPWQEGNAGRQACTGRVWLDGETWLARTEASIKAGETVRVRGMQDLTVIVEPIAHTPLQQQAGSRNTG